MAVIITDDLKQHVAAHKDCYEPGVLQPEAHQRLVESLSVVTRQANVPKHFITHSMKEHCSDNEVEWVMTYRKHIAEGSAGLCIVSGKNVEDQCLYMAGAFIRNFVDARVIPVQEVIAKTEAGDPPDCSVLIVPNFYLAKQEGGHLAQWHISALYSLLLRRYTHGQATIVYVQNMKGLEAEYGRTLHEHLNNHFDLVGG